MLIYLPVRADLSGGRHLATIDNYFGHLERPEPVPSEPATDPLWLTIGLVGFIVVGVVVLILMTRKQRQGGSGFDLSEGWGDGDGGGGDGGGGGD